MQFSEKRNNTTIEKRACHGYASILRILMAGSYVRVKISLDENEKCDILRLQNFTKQKGKKEWGCELRNLLRFNC